MQESSSAEPEVEAVGGGETAWGEERAKEGVVVAAVGEGSLTDREDIRHATDKTVVGVRGGEVLSEEIPKGVGEKTDCMKVGQGGHAEMEVEAGRLDVRDVDLGRQAGSGHTNSEAGKGDRGEGRYEDLGQKIVSREELTCGECVEGVLIDVELPRGRF